MPPGRRKRSRPSTTPRCAISSFTCTGCSIPRRPARRASTDRGSKVLSSRRIARSRFVQETIGFLAAHYLQLVWRTTRLHVEPANIYEQITPQMPIIVAMWHGQHFLMPFIRRPQHRVKVLVSTHRDGEINAITARRLGTGTIRGSGAHGMDFHKKGVVSACHEILKALADGYKRAVH